MSGQHEKSRLTRQNSVYITIELSSRAPGHFSSTPSLLPACPQNQRIGHQVRAEVSSGRDKSRSIGYAGSQSRVLWHLASHSCCQRHLVGWLRAGHSFGIRSDSRVPRRLITDQHCGSMGTGCHHLVSATPWDPFPVCSGRTVCGSAVSVLSSRMTSLTEKDSREPSETPGAGQLQRDFGIHNS